MSYRFYGLQPYKHQLEIIKFMLSNNRGYNFSAMGSGKTASSIWFCDILLERQKIKLVLIVCPLSIIGSVWVEEIKRIVPNRSYSIIHGNRDKRIKAMNSNAAFHIINPDAFRTYHEELNLIGYDVVIVDEADCFKNPSSKRSKGFYKVAKHAKGVYGLTGTPMGNSPEDAFGIAKAINPSKMPTPYITRWRQLTMLQLAPYIWIPNEQAEKIVHETLQPAIRYTLEDCVDIPDITYEYRKFKMTKLQAKLYDDIYKHQVAEYEGGTIVAGTAAVKFTKLLQIAGGVVYNDEGIPVALPIKDKIEEINHIQQEVGQVIIFCQFIEILKHLRAQIPNSRVLYGAISQKQRSRDLADFKSGKYDVLIAQPRVAAHGLNLQFCSTIIFFGPILGNSYYRQAIARIRRSGQKKKQVIINFFSSAAEKQMYKTLETKNVSSELLLKMYEK